MEPPIFQNYIQGEYVDHYMNIVQYALYM